ncbi:hypothetical protein QF034_004162 [Streptomyces africanus]|uniref:Uncharacterized protein n=1 Tax=Streptomyces africanus TaxID=231024 RepID=A0ABU0QRB0_9ACTN|nr:hypothetical protein [Streptomyces africanus]MDQ0749931.1 hypothetical protein [Streptomyces africanus]
MLTHTANGGSPLSCEPLSFWPRVREFAVPPSMIETATARRRAGDWAGACAAAGVDVDLQPRAVARVHGPELAARLREDLRHLAPDLLRWHMPRIAPDGLLRPGLTVTLARYDAAGRDGVRPLHLVVRTPPAWADAGQRMSLALWDASHAAAADRRHPHPRPSRRFRLDLHRHLWDARHAGELGVRCGAERSSGDDRSAVAGDTAVDTAMNRELAGLLPPGHQGAVDRWAAEAAILLRAEGPSSSRVCVRLAARTRLVLDLSDGAVTAYGHRGDSSLPVLPDAATWVLPDLALLRAGAIDAGRLHPLVASALRVERVPAGTSRVPQRAGDARLVECRGARHRIGLADGVLAALDHDPAEIRREELLAALGGPPLPCLRAIDDAHRRPDCLTGVRERLDHGDVAGALAVVEGLLGPEAVLRNGPLRDALETAARRRIAYGLFRAGLDGPSPGRLRPGDLNASRHRGAATRPAPSFF